MLILASSISKIVDIVTVIGVIIVVIVLIACGTFIYFMKFRKSKGIKEDNKDFSALNRKDTKDYIKIDDIKDNMIISGNRYMAAITCLGNDFFDKPGSERYSIKSNYTSFIGMWKSPVVYRQSSKAVDLVGHINRYEKRVEVLREQSVALAVDYEDLKMEATRYRSLNDMDSLEIVLEAMEKAERQSVVCNDRLARMEEQLKFIKICANGVYSADSEELYVFSWEYAPGMEGFLKEPSADEIYQKAATELNNMANSYINALANAKVAARRCSSKELELICYRYFHPTSGIMIADSEYGNNSNFVEIVTVPEKDELFDEFVMEQAKELSAKSVERFLDEVEQKMNEPVKYEDTITDDLDVPSDDLDVPSDDLLSDDLDMPSDSGSSNILDLDNNIEETHNNKEETNEPILNSVKSNSIDNIVLESKKDSKKEFFTL